MRKVVLGILCLCSSIALAKDLVEAKLPRAEDGKDVYIRGLLDKSPTANGRVLLLFKGYPGIVKIDADGAVATSNLQEHFEVMIPALLAEGISTVMMDCPTDQWGRKCSDAYRSSTQHADDVQTFIAALKKTGNFQEVFAMGHSYGAVSTHWLSVNLGGHLTGVIHSATQSRSPGFINSDLAASMKKFSHVDAKVPYLYLHHKDDRCHLTPYDYASKHAKDGALITVLGGDFSGPACGAGGLHGYADRRPMVAAALAKWINTREVVPVVKGPLD